MIVLSQGTTPYLSLLIRGYDLTNTGAIVLLENIPYHL